MNSQFAGTLLAEPFFLSLDFAVLDKDSALNQ